MKHTRVVLSLLLTASSGVALAQSSSATPYFNIRSQSANLALEMVGQEGYINRYDSEGNYTVFSITPAFQQSFRSGDLACCLFGEDLVKCGDCSQITISGSQVSGTRGSRDWLADYFGLPTDFKSTIKFSPRIRNVLVDANFYMGLDDWKEGMYFRMHIPFVHTRWELNYCETVCAKGTNNHLFGYFSGNNPPSGDPNFCSENGIGNLRSELLCSAADFFSNSKAPNLSNTLRFGPISNEDDQGDLCGGAINGLDTIQYTDSIVFEPLNYARWAGCECSPLTKNGVADWRFTLGYNAYQSEKFHVGFGITGAAPTGNRPHGEYLFEPVIGNGNHWELGGQFTSHYRFWQSEDEEKHFTAYLDANITHLFKARQTRSFDLKNRPNSRYMLAMQLGEPCNLYNAILQRCIPDGQSGEDPGYGTLTSGLTEAVAQFAHVYAPVANLTTVDVNVNIGAQIDLALMFNYTSRNWSFDLGYNLWARTCERIKLDCKCPTRLSDGTSWALKGDAYVYGVTAGCGDMRICTSNCADDTARTWKATLTTNDPYALGATQSKATIHKGTNDTATVSAPGFSGSFVNPGIDNPRFAGTRIDLEVCPANNSEREMSPQARAAASAFVTLNGGCDTSQVNNGRRIMNSKRPVYLTENDLDLDGAATKGLSHKVFAHLSYQWLRKEADGYVPFFGIGASGEFANNSGDCCATSCTTSSSSSSSSSSSTNSCNKTCDDVCGLGCKRCALSQWSVWVKGGFSFN